MDKDQLQKISGLIELALTATQKSEYYEVNFEFIGEDVEFRIYRKGETKDILMWESISFGYFFEEKYGPLFDVLNHLDDHGVMPDVYPMRMPPENNED